MTEFQILPSTLGFITIDIRGICLGGTCDHDHCQENRSNDNWVWCSTGFLRLKMADVNVRSSLNFWLENWRCPCGTSRSQQGIFLFSAINKSKTKDDRRWTILHGSGRLFCCLWWHWCPWLCWKPWLQGELGVFWAIVGGEDLKGTSKFEEPLLFFSRISKFLSTAWSLSSLYISLKEKIFRKKTQVEISALHPKKRARLFQSFSRPGYEAPDVQRLRMSQRPFESWFGTRSRRRQNVTSVIFLGGKRWNNTGDSFEKRYSQMQYLP